MKYEWGPWIEHDGKGCPIKGQLAQVQFAKKITRAPAHYIIIADNIAQGIVRTSPLGRNGNSWDWRRGNKVIRYRVRRPRVTEWLDQVTSDLPKKVDA